MAPDCSIQLEERPQSTYPNIYFALDDFETAAAGGCDLSSDAHNYVVVLQVRA